MLSRKKFEVIETEEVRIELSDLTVFELFRDLVKDLIYGEIEFLKMDALLYILHFCEFENDPKDRVKIKEGECIIRTGAYETDFGYDRLYDLLGSLQSSLTHDYFLQGAIILTEDNRLVNNLFYIKPILN
ncbi:MAG: hypothetical protein BAJALOKI3v1_320036 [Promethearchaeota archaeon]|nr:MAG: hypothetical protein BAJALOKI3v1_320036 [Candidatus Lokiarchaeota archaeon]